jgi:hypothetical protein
MQDRAEYHLKATGKSSALDWPSHAMQTEARRARGKYLRELVISFATGLRTSIAAVRTAEYPGHGDRIRPQ